MDNPALISGKINPKATTIAFWIFTALFCLEMSFTAYYELRPAAGGGGVHTPRLPGRLLPGGALMGQSGRRGWHCSSPGGPRGSISDQRMGICRLRHQPRLGAHRTPLDPRSPGGVCPVVDYQRPLGPSYYFWRRLQTAWLLNLCNQGTRCLRAIRHRRAPGNPLRV